MWIFLTKVDFREMGRKTKGIVYYAALRYPNPTSIDYTSLENVVDVV